MKMKNLLSTLLISVCFLLGVTGQTPVTLTGSEPGKFLTFANTASDTLTASAAKAYTFAILAPSNCDATVQVVTTSVSGTPAYTAKIEQSNDNANYSAIRGLQNVVHTGGGNNSLIWNTWTDTTAITTRYIKVTVTATSATQKSTIKGYAKIVKK